MPWTVRHEDEKGTPLTRHHIVVEFGSLPTGKVFPLCSMIDQSRYYDTVLNPHQRSILVAEIDAAAMPEKSLDALKSMAIESAGPHVYLRFIGD